MLQQSSILLTGLLFGIIFNAPFQYFINPLRIVFVIVFFIGIFLTVKNDLKNSEYLIHYYFLFLVSLLGLISLNIASLPLNIAIKALYTNISIIFGFFAFRYYDKFKILLVYFVIISLIVMIFDIYNLEYLFNFDPILNYYQVDRAKGLFSYSKEAGSFSIFAALIFRNQPKILVLLFLTSILTGSRSAIIFIFIVLLIDMVFYNRSKFNLKFFIAVVIGILVIFLSLYIIYEINDSLFRRMNNSFDFSDSGTHSYRFFIWDQYLNQLEKFSLVHILFGNLGYIESVLGNGAENAYLTIWANSGLFLFIIYYLPILFLAVLSSINFRLLYPFILLVILLQFGRQGTGWADGILLWAYVFHIYDSPYMNSIFKRIRRKRD